MIEKRKCCMCQEMKDLSWFSSRREYRCRPCGSLRSESRRGYYREWWQKTKEIRMAITVQWVKDNPKRRKEINNAWYQRNKEQACASSRAYRKKENDRYRAHCIKRRALMRGSHHVPYKVSELLERDNHTCQYCGGDGNQLEHMQPMSRGGHNAEYNILVSCGPCNLSKGARGILEWKYM